MISQKAGSAGYGFGWWVVATIVLLTLLGCTFVSGLANIYAWKETAGEGTIFFGIPKQGVNVLFGLISEVCGTVGLILTLWCFRAKAYSAALAALMLTIVGVSFNGYSNYRYFTIVSQDKVEDRTAELEEQNDKSSEINSLKEQLKTIGPQRPSETIQEQLDALPVNRVTRRDELKDELGWAQTREKIQANIVRLEGQQGTATGSEIDGDRELVQDDRVWIFASALIEAFKALAAWILLSTNGGAPVRTESPKKADQKRRSNPEKKVREAETVHPVHAQIETVREAVETPALAIVKPVQKPTAEVTFPIAPSDDHDVVLGDDGKPKVVRIIM